MIDFYCLYTKIDCIDQVNNANVMALFTYGREERKWKPATHLVFYQSLKVFFRWCVEKNHMGTNPSDRIEVPKIVRGIPKKLTKQESSRILDVVNNYPYPFKFLRSRNYAIFATFLFAGLRKQELLNLKYSDVDIENLSILSDKEEKDRKTVSFP